MKNLRVFNSEYPCVDSFICFFKSTYFRRKLFYLRFIGPLNTLKCFCIRVCGEISVFYAMLPCQYIALRYWILTGEIMEEYLELFAENQQLL